LNVTFEQSRRRTTLHCQPDSMRHKPSGLIRAEAKSPHELKGANTLLTGSHHVDCPNPLCKGKVRIFKDCSDRNRELFFAIAAAAKTGAAGSALHSVGID
jgi:hypothetical protein